MIVTKVSTQSNSSFQLYLGCRSGINSSKYDVEEVSIDPPIIDNFQDIHLELYAKIKHNAHLDDGFHN